MPYEVRKSSVFHATAAVFDLAGFEFIDRHITIKV